MICINDAPALKQSDIGISILMHLILPKRAADLILMNSDTDQLFLSIVEALKFGRLVFEKFEKTICYLLPAGSYSELASGDECVLRYATNVVVIPYDYYLLFN